MMKFNINGYVRVKLNDRGRAILKKNHDDLAKHGSLGEFVLHEKDGWYKQQLWVLMQEFGPHISMGKLPPFDTEIEILEDG